MRDFTICDLPKPIILSRKLFFFWCRQLFNSFIVDHRKSCRGIFEERRYRVVHPDEDKPQIPTLRTSENPPTNMSIESWQSSLNRMVERLGSFLHIPVTPW